MDSAPQRRCLLRPRCLWERSPKQGQPRKEQGRVRARGLRKANREVDVVFIEVLSFCLVGNCLAVRMSPSLAVTLREESQLESPSVETPNGLSAHCKSAENSNALSTENNVGPCPTFTLRLD